MHKRYFFILLIICLAADIKSFSQQDVVYGPFKSWANLKTIYGAYGDGTHDDTRALQTALNELGQNGHAPVLFIPAGTYRITGTLTMQTRKGIGIIGEDPEKTVIKWDGATGMKMFELNGVSYSEYSRITWDGSNKALVAIAHEWDGKVPFANSGTQHSDEIFLNIGIGLKSGPKMDAEFAIRRCRFYNCSATGISLGGFNALDWWIWECYFENCANGVANNVPGNGAGNFHVYHSIFKGSTHADISLGNSEFYSFRDNISFNSNCFIAASQFSNTSPITIQGNTIITQQDKTMALLFTKGNILFLDNTFITPEQGKKVVIDNTDFFRTPPPDVILVGNSFTATENLFINPSGRTINLETKSGILPPKNLPAIVPFPFAKFAVTNVLEANPKMNANDIQMLIKEAVSTRKKAVIHFSYGIYTITKTLNIPGNAAIVLTGDGLSSTLNWAGDSSNAMFDIASPGKAVLQNLYLDCKGKTDCILIHDNDQQGNSVYTDQLLLYHGVQSNLLINGFSKTDFRFDDFQHNYCSKNGTSVKLIGNNDKAQCLVKVFGGESSNMGNSYSVSKGARILLFDTWYENGTSSLFLRLRNDGEFVLNGGKIANTVANAQIEPFIDIDSFRGKVTLTEIILNEPKKTIQFTNRYKSASFMTTGILSWNDTTKNYFIFPYNTDGYATRNNRYNIGNGSYPIADMGNTTDAFIATMFSTIRQTKVSQKIAPQNSMNSSLFLKRVMIENGINNVRIERVQK